MSLNMQHKGLIHGWEILPPILEMPSFLNITAFNGSWFSLKKMLIDLQKENFVEMEEVNLNDE